MNTDFQNGDLVTTRTGPALGDDAVTGRVIGYHDPSGGAYFPGFYIILLTKPIEGFPWSSLILPGSMLDKLTVLDEMVMAQDFLCPNCKG